MTRSMTGFGKAVCNEDGESFSVELSAVNHRYLDCSVRLPPPWSALETSVKACVKERFGRGKIQVYVSRKNSAAGSQPMRLDVERARQYVEDARHLTRLVGTFEGLSVNTLVTMDGVFVPAEPDDDLEAVEERLLASLNEAMDQLETMRQNEGQALAEDLRKRVALIREILEAVEERLPTLNQQYEQRLRERIQELAADISLTEERIAIEVAMMADKGDVTEEVVRLKTHLDHIVELLDSVEPCGRRLDFLAQEIQREANTLGVKTRDTEVTKEMLRIKSEIEKIREQVQNIE